MDLLSFIVAIIIVAVVIFASIGFLFSLGSVIIGLKGLILLALGSLIAAVILLVFFK